MRIRDVADASLNLLNMKWIEVPARGRDDVTKKYEKISQTRCPAHLQQKKL